MSVVKCRLMTASPFFCRTQALQGEEDGLEASDLLLIHTFMGLAMAAGTVIVGLVVLRPSPQCLISLQYLCQATLYGIGNDPISRLRFFKTISI